MEFQWYETPLDHDTPEVSILSHDYFLFRFNALAFLDGHYLGAIDAETVAYEISGADPVRYMSLSGTLNTLSGDGIIDSIYYFNADVDPVITWDGARLLISVLDDASGGSFATILNGNDSIFGNSFRDVIKGGFGNDRLYGNGGNDTLFGEAGNDQMAGGVGNDILIGGLGRDVLTGGPGSDLFDFNSAAETALRTPDKISDFRKGIDAIDLSSIDANASKLGNQAFTKLFVKSTFDGLFDGNLVGAGKLVYVTGSDVLIGNTDSDPTPEFSLKITLAGQLAPTVQDFIL